MRYTLEESRGKTLRTGDEIVLPEGQTFFGAKVIVIDENAPEGLHMFIDRESIRTLLLKPKPKQAPIAPLIVPVKF